MITFPIYLISGRNAQSPMLLKAASMPISVPLFSSLESAGYFLAQSDFEWDTEIWRIESATALVPWLERVADQCQCVPWDIANNRGTWQSAGAAKFEEFFDAVSWRAAREQLTHQN